MSYTEIHMTTSNGKVSTVKRIPNAILGALAIWTILGKHKLLDRPPFWNAILNASDVWELFETPRLNRMERRVLGSTFDKVMVKRENLGELAWLFDEFNSTYNPAGNNKSTLPQQAEALREAAKDDKCYAIFWTQTSVASDIWSVYDDKLEYSRWYDITRDEGHWFLFEECEKTEKKLLNQ